MERVNTFNSGADQFDVPESEQDAFGKEMEGEKLDEVRKFRDDQGNRYEVPEPEFGAFQQEMQGVNVESVNTVRANGQLWEVPESEANDFMSFYNKDEQFAKEREQHALEAAKKFDAQGPSFWDEAKQLAQMYTERAGAGALNVVKGVAQAPPTIATEVIALAQFASRIGNLPYVRNAIAMTPGASLGPAVMDLMYGGKDGSAYRDLIGKDGSAYRDLLGKVRTYIDDWKEENLGFRNEQGEKPTEDGDWLLTLGGQAANSVTMAYMLSAPAFMQKANKAISFGKLSPTLQTILYGVSTAESTAGKAEKKGFSPAEAVAYGAMTGTLEAAFESISQKFGLQGTMAAEPMKLALGKMIFKRALGAVGEGATETAQQLQQGTIEKLAKIDEKEWSQIGFETMQAGLAGLLSGGAAEVSQASLVGIDTLQQRRQANELRAQQEGAAVEMGRQAQQESVLLTPPTPTPEGQADVPGQGPVASEPIAPDSPEGYAEAGSRGSEAGGSASQEATPRREYTGLEEGLVEMPATEAKQGTSQGNADFRTSGERMAQAQPLDIGKGVTAQGIVRIGRKGGTGKGIESVKLLLPGGKVFYSEDPGLMALTRYWYQDRVLFPPSPAGDRGAQEGDTRMNAARRAGFEIPPGKRVLVYVGNSKKQYRATVVDVIDNNTVKVHVEKTRRSKDNNKDGYRDVDVRMISQFKNVIGSQKRAALTKGMSKEEADKLAADAKKFDSEIIDAGVFIDQEGYMDAKALEGTQKGGEKMQQEMQSAYANASAVLGIPLDNHVQRARALHLLDDAHTKLLGSEGMSYDAWVDQLAQEGEQEMQAKRASGEFSLADMTPDEQTAADEKLMRQMKATDDRRKMLARAAAPLEGNAGDMTGELFGAFDDAPLFGAAADENINLVDDTRPTDELFNMATGGVYNQEESGGADTPRAQETPVNPRDIDIAGPPSENEKHQYGMDLMDAVRMFYDLTGKLPKIKEKLRNREALGLFRKSTQDIELLASIFGLYDDVDAARIRKGLEARGFQGPKLDAQIAVEVKALIEKRRKEHMKRPLKVMVHELSHLVDYLPDSMIQERGNILGHIAAMKKGLAQAIGPEPGAAGPLTDGEKAKLRTRAEKQMKDLLGEARTEIEQVTREVPEYAVLGIKPDDVKALLGMDGKTATPELYDWFSRQETQVKREVLIASMKGVIDERMAALGSRVQTGTRTVKETIQRDIPGYTREDGRRRFRELLKAETEKRRLIELKTIKEEAATIIPWWRGSKELEDHFTSPSEMYAELFGIFLADPGELQARAPTVYRAFTGYMMARPEVASAYRAFVDEKALPADKRMKEKFRMFRKGMTKADEAARREVLALMTEPSKAHNTAAQKYLFHRRSAPTKMTLDNGLRTLLEAAKTQPERERIQKIYETARVQIKKIAAVGRRMQDFDSQIEHRVNKPLMAAGFDMEDLNEYKALMRIAWELDGKAAPAGVEPVTALQMLDARRQEYGEDRFKVLEKASKEFRRISEKHVLSDIDIRSMHSEELLEKLDKNVEYVTFKHVNSVEDLNKIKKAMKDKNSKDRKEAMEAGDILSQEIEGKLGSTIGSKIYKYVGSFGNIQNTIVATLDKYDQMLRAATRNSLKRMVHEIAGEAGLAEFIMPAQMERNMKGVMVPKMVDNNNWRTVVYMDKGEIKGFVAMRPLADSLEHWSFQDVGLLRTFMHFNSTIKKLYTQLAYGFAMRNNPKDANRAVNLVPGLEHMGLPGVSINLIPGGAIIGTLQRYNIPRAVAKAVLPEFMFNGNMIEFRLAKARQAAIMIQKSTIPAVEDRIQQLLQQGRTDEANKLMATMTLAKEGLENPILMTKIEALREDSLMDDYSRHLFKYGVKGEDIKKGLNLAAHLRGAFRFVGSTLEGWGETGELTTKLAVWDYLKTRTDISHEQKILITRELGGSPDFSEFGSVMSYIEFATRPFVNASKEGTIGYVDAIKRDPSGASLKLIKHTIVPTIVRWSLFSGFALAAYKLKFTDEKDRENDWFYHFLNWAYNSMKNVSNYKKKLFHSYPMPVDTGSVKFPLVLSAPMDQTEQVFSTMIWNGMDAMGEMLLDQIKQSRDPNAAPAVLSTTEKPFNEVWDLVLNSFMPTRMAEAPGTGLLALTYGFIFGTNYEDSFRGKDVWTEDEMITRFERPEAIRKLKDEYWNRLGGASVIRLKSTDDLGVEPPPKLYYFLNAPLIQGSIGSFLNVHTGGEAQMERKLGRIKKVMEAPIKLEAKADLVRAIKEGGGKTAVISQDFIIKMKPAEGSTYTDLVKSQIYTEEFQRILGDWSRNNAINSSIGVPAYKAAKEDNPILRDIRYDILNRAPDMKR